MRAAPLLERFARLSSGTVDFNAVAGGGQGDTKAELMAVLGLMSPAASAFVIIKYINSFTMNEVLACGRKNLDKAMQPDVGTAVATIKQCHRFMLQRAEVVSKEGDWRPRELETVQRLAECALAESSTFTACHKCNGTKQSKRAGVFSICPTCQGLGRRKFSDRAYADLIGVTHRTWAARWGWRYVALLNICDEWEREATRVVRRERGV